MKIDVEQPSSNQAQSGDGNGRSAKSIDWKKIQRRMIKDAAPERGTKTSVTPAAKGRGKKKTKSPARSTESPLLWLLPVEFGAAVSIEQWHKSARSGKGLKKTAAALIQWSQEVALAPGKASLESAYTAIAVARTLPAVAANLSHDEIECVVSRLIELANLQPSGECPLTEQLIAVELPLQTGMAIRAKQLPELKRLTERALSVMQTSISGNLDGDGWIRSEYFEQFGLLIASWARTLPMLARHKLKLDQSARSQLEWLARLYMMLVRPDGTFAGTVGNSLTEKHTRTVSPELTSAVLAMSSDSHDPVLADLCLNGVKTSLDEIPEESALSEWAHSAVLKADWKPRTGRCVTTFGNRDCRLEIGCETNLIGGDCTPQISFNDQPLAITDGPDVLLWDQDEDGDYLELSFDLEGGVQLERQIFMAREEEFLLVSDAIISEKAGRISYRCDFPMAPGIDGLEESETTEIYLKDKKIQALVLPFSLSEWKTERRAGSLKCTADTLTLNQSVENRSSLYTGLFFDLNRKRSARPRTWRRLTVAETLQIVKDDVAVAFRIRVGDDQWVLYRSLTHSANRSFIGYNIYEGFFIGRFDPDGTIEPLVETE